MSTLSVSSPALHHGFRVKLAVVLAAGCSKAGQQYFLSPAELRSAGLSVEDLHFLLRNPLMGSAEPAAILDGLIQDRDGNVVFSLNFDLAP